MPGVVIVKIGGELWCFYGEDVLERQSNREIVWSKKTKLDSVFDGIIEFDRAQDKLIDEAKKYAQQRGLIVKNLNA